MDWRIYHSVNTFVAEHSWLGSLFRVVETYGTIGIAVAAFALWLLARPGGSRKWKLASASALASAAIGLLVNSIIADVWMRDRPYETHRVLHIWGPHKTDASFPSDHASAAFGIAVAVILIDPLVGAAFLVLAFLIGVGRVIVGEHYPGDVLAGAAIGTVVALLVVRLGRPVLAVLVRGVERLTDPVLALVWRRVPAGR